MLPMIKKAMLDADEPVSLLQYSSKLGRFQSMYKKMDRDGLLLQLTPIKVKGETIDVFEFVQMYRNLDIMVDDPYPINVTALVDLELYAQKGKAVAAVEKLGPKAYKKLKERVRRLL